MSAPTSKENTAVDTYMDRYQKWKAAKDAEIVTRKPKPLAVLPANITVHTLQYTPVASKPVAVERIVATTKVAPLRDLAPPSLSRVEQLAAWREERERQGVATPMRKAPLSPRSLNIKGTAQRQVAPPGTPQVVKVEENKQNTKIADARALALHAVSQGRPAEGRMLLLQLRQADASVVHNPYWWIARARLEEEAKNSSEVVQLFEQALKECHISAYAMLDDGLRSFMMRQINSVPGETKVDEADAPEEEANDRDADEQENSDEDDIEGLLDSPDSYMPNLEIRDLTQVFDSMAVRDSSESSQIQDAVVKQERMEDPELGFSNPFANPHKQMGIIVARSQTRDLTSTEQSTASATAGSVIAYEQVKVGKKDQQALGAKRALTPVRRSARTGCAVEKQDMKEALAAADFAFAPNAALAPRQHQTGNKSDLIEVPDDCDDQILAKTPSASVHAVLKEEPMDDDEIEISIKRELKDEESYGRYDTYAPSAAGARLVSRVASPATAASLFAVTPVRRSRRLPGSSQATPSATAPYTREMVVPNLHVSTPATMAVKPAAKKI